MPENEWVEMLVFQLSRGIVQGMPLESFYEQKGVLQNVDGERPPDAVFEQLDRFCSKGA